MSLSVSLGESALLSHLALFYVVLHMACHLALLKNDGSGAFTFLCILDLAEGLFQVAVDEKDDLGMTFVIWADRISE